MRQHQVRHLQIVIDEFLFRDAFCRKHDAVGMRDVNAFGLSFHSELTLHGRALVADFFEPDFGDARPVAGFFLARARWVPVRLTALAVGIGFSLITDRAGLSDRSPLKLP